MEGCFILVAVLVPLAVVIVPFLVVYRRATAAQEAVEALQREVRALEAQLGLRRPAAPNAAGSPPPAAPDRSASPSDRSASGSPADGWGSRPFPGIGPAAGPAPDRSASSSDRSASGPSPGAEPATGPSSDRPASGAYQGVSAAARLEAQIGSRWLLFVGATVLVLGVGFFVKHAFENEWITPLMRVIAGAIAGVTLVVAGSRFVRRGYALYGQIVTGGGLAMLYLSTYAAFTYYGLISRTPAFTLMVVITAAAALLADRQRSPGLAGMAVGGGFLTPFLVGGAADAQVTLFTYTAILVAGTMYLAHRRAWIGLNVLSFAFTVVTVLAWAAEHYRPSKYAVTEAFLTLFCAMFLVILRATVRSRHPSAPAAAVVLAAGPVLYYLASLGLLYAHATALMVFLIGVTTAGIAAGVYYGRPAIRLAAWVLAILPFFAWLSTHTGGAWTSLALMTLGAIYAMHLMAAQEHLRRSGGAEGSDVLLFHLNGLTLFLGAYTILDAVHAAPGATVAAVLAAWNLGLAGLESRRNRLAALHPLGLAFALAAIAVTLGFGGLWITVGWAAEAAAIIWVGLVARRAWFRLGGGLLLALASVRYLVLDQAAISVGFTPVVNARVAAGAFIVALCYLLAYLYRAIGDEPGAGRAQRSVLVAAANLLTIWMATVEITAYFRGGLDAAHRRAIGQLATAAAWGVYAFGLVAVGRRGRRTQAATAFVAGGLLLMLLAVMRLLSVELAGQAARFAPIANPHFAVGTTLVGILYAMAALARREGPLPSALVDALRVGASILGVIVLTVEVGTFWHAGAPAGQRSALAEQMSVSVLWTAYAMVLIVVGILRRYAPIRYVAIALFGLAITKVFLFDLSYLAGIYRVIGFVAVGSILLLASFLYQRFAVGLVAPGPRERS